ncbi:MAG: hypothetical protein JAY60_11425, partial [Candidatus Thiodiazotropha weberae]|nr:hypothetical protein [Candidatus Thiodiazotropha weberae]
METSILVMRIFIHMRVLMDTPPLPRPLSRKGRGELLSPSVWCADDWVLYLTFIFFLGIAFHVTNYDRLEKPTEINPLVSI